MALFPLYVSNQREKQFQRLPCHYLNSMLFEKYLKNFEASGFFIKILLRHETGWNSVNNSQSLRLVLEISFFRRTEVHTALKMQEQATHMTWVHDKLPATWRQALVHSSFRQTQTLTVSLVTAIRTPWIFRLVYFTLLLISQQHAVSLLRYRFAQ